MNSFILVLVCIIGACLGSFYNVVILRSISGESIIMPPSKCPKCGRKLLFWHNIPIISYILLKGKCYFCHEKISIQYPIIEIITMLLFAFSYIRFDLSLKFYFAIILISTLLIMSVTDIKERMVNCNIAIGLAVIGIIYNFMISPKWGWYSILGAIIAAFIVEMIARIGVKPLNSRIFGEGDTYVAGAIGACFGMYYVGTLLIYTVIASMLYALPLFIRKQFQLGNTAICILLCIFITAAIFYRYFQNIFLFSIIALSGIILAIKIFKSIGKNKDDKILIPFVPAFFVAALLLLFN